IQKPKNVFFNQAPFTQRRQRKDCCCYLSPARCGRGVGAWSVKGKPGSPDNLAGSEMANRVVVERKAQALAATETASVTRATSISSGSGIGEALPSRTAVTNASTQAVCPLSCLHNLMALKPGQPKPRSVRKLSSCSTRPPQKTFRRSLGNDRWPFDK